MEARVSHYGIEIASCDVCVSVQSVIVDVTSYQEPLLRISRQGVTGPASGLFTSHFTPLFLDRGHNVCGATSWLALNVRLLGNADSSMENPRYADGGLWVATVLLQ